jgi:hypothetical protein
LTLPGPPPNDSGGGFPASSAWISISTQKSVPKIVDDGEIAVGMFMMNKMELLLSPEPSKS